MSWCRSRRSRWSRPSSSAKARRRCCKVVQAGAPSFPVEIFGFITMFAVANSALINMLMASRLVYGMSRERVLPTVLGKVHPIAPHALCRDRLHDAAGVRPDHLRRRGPGARRHHCAAAAVRLHRRQHRRAGAAPRPVDHKHFRTPTILPILGTLELRLPGRSMDRPRFRSVQDCRRSDRHRRRAVGRDRAGQSRHRSQARGARDGGHRRARSGELAHVPEEWIPVSERDMRQRDAVQSAVTPRQYVWMIDFMLQPA